MIYLNGYQIKLRAYPSEVYSALSPSMRPGLVEARLDVVSNDPSELEQFLQRWMSTPGVEVLLETQMDTKVCRVCQRCVPRGTPQGQRVSHDPCPSCGWERIPSMVSNYPAPTPLTYENLTRTMRQMAGTGAPDQKPAAGLVQPEKRVPEPAPEPTVPNRFSFLEVD